VGGAPERRVALVTGSARGIGRAIVGALVDAGHVVVGVDRLPQDDDRLARAFEADLADPAVPARIAAEVGRVDVLVNNAAVLVSMPFAEMPVADFDRTIAVNLRAPYLLCQAFGRGMVSRGWGRIVNVASIAARTGGVTNVSAYAASKGGLVALTKSLARELGPGGVTVNAVAPGAIDTPMSADIPPAARERFIDDIPLGRFAGPGEVASVVAFLAGDGASWINGATIDVNGGWVMS
jgi:NAD(P)-dependent dehydrogenase (short-subunit alcohol dehydrogenase family)